MSALWDLAERYGIELSFCDAKGQMQRVSEKTARALLGAMGIHADNEASAKRVLADLERAEWTRLLPSVCVVRSRDGMAWIDLTMLAGAGDVSWRIELEDGDQRSGEAHFQTLEMAAAWEATGQRRERRRLCLGKDIPFGYHRLTINQESTAALIVAPEQCVLPDAIAHGQRLWGVSAQLYLLRSERNWGIGDYGDLHRLVEIMAERGADIVGLNPLHALFLDDPEHASPYSPNSRLLLNILNIDVSAIPELDNCTEARELITSQSFCAQIDACRQKSRVDYSAVSALKQKALRLLFASCSLKRGAPRWDAFESFRQQCSAAFHRACLFQALREFFSKKDRKHADWRTWPQAYQDPCSSGVSDFARNQEELVSFHTWMQFIADEQLQSAASAAQKMAIGVYRDLAVGANPCGADGWSNQAAIVKGAHIGAPPDVFNPMGQDWGLPPFHPHALREEAYKSFIEVIRANVRHAGALRIDHAMALQHVYWVPEGMPPSEGAYVRSPIDDLMAVLALESHRNRCLIIAEDLGTVPEGFRERIAKENILCYRVLYFEKDGKGFIPPDRYPALAVAVASNHDLPTLRAWCQGIDIDEKQQRQLFQRPEDAGRARDERRRDIAELLQQFRVAGLVPADRECSPDEFAEAAHAYLARTRSVLALAQIDDITGETDPVNVPASSDGNWRRCLSVTLEQLEGDARLAKLAAIFSRERASLAQAKSR